MRVLSPSPSERGGERRVIALLPGSRKQEIQTMLPVMMKMKKKFPDHEFVVAAAPSLEKSFYEEILGNSGIRIVYDQTYDLLRDAKAALVTSGTATLETALIGVPEVVCYKGGNISFAIAKRLVKVDYISLVNLIMKKEVVKELIQDQFNETDLEKELKKILQDENFRKNILNDYVSLKEKLGGSGASKRTAELMVKYLGEKKN